LNHAVYIHTYIRWTKGTCTKNPKEWVWGATGTV